MIAAIIQSCQEVRFKALGSKVAYSIFHELTEYKSNERSHHNQLQGERKNKVVYYDREVIREQRPFTQAVRETSDVLMNLSHALLYGYQENSLQSIFPCIKKHRIVCGVRSNPIIPAN